MKLIEQQIEIGSLVLTWERAYNEDLGWSFTIQRKDGGEIVVGNTYRDDIDLDDLTECLQQVKKFKEEN